MTKSHGHEVRALTKDHKPMEPNEYERITKNGGKIYQSQTVFKGPNQTPVIQQVNIEQIIHESEQEKDNPLVGPYRVAPGRLSVSRTFGDIEAKYPDLGGMEGVVVCDPDITYVRNGGLDLDFIVIGSDGIFDKLSNHDLGEIVWNVVREHQQNLSVSLHAICGKAADEILKEAAKQKSMDNISIVMIAFKPLQDYLDKVRFCKDQNEDQEQTPQAMSEAPKNYWTTDSKSQSQKVNHLFKSINNNENQKMEQLRQKLNSQLQDPSTGIVQGQIQIPNTSYQVNNKSRNNGPYGNVGGGNVNMTGSVIGNHSFATSISHAQTLDSSQESATHVAN